MKTTIKKTAQELGFELKTLFLEMYGDDLIFIEELIDEALHALKHARKDFGLEEISLSNEYFDEAA